MIKLYLAEDQQLLNTALTMILNLETDLKLLVLQQMVIRHYLTSSN